MKKFLKKVLAVLVLIAVIIGVPIGINECYKANEGYVTVWGGADVLSYYGAIVASAGAAIGVFFSIKAANKNYQDDVRARTLPFIALTLLEQKTALNVLALLKKKAEESQNPPTSNAAPAAQYEEYRLDHIYFIITAHGIIAQNKLSKEQETILENGGNVWVRSADGTETLQHIEFYSTPMEIENVGNGTAVNFRVGLNAAGNQADYTYIRPMMLKQGQTRYIHIFSSEKYEVIEGNYLLEFCYEDIYGNKYLQQFPLSFGKNADGKRFRSIDLVGKQTRLTGGNNHA